MSTEEPGVYDVEDMYLRSRLQPGETYRQIVAERDAAYAQLREWWKQNIRRGACPCGAYKRYEGWTYVPHKSDCPTAKALAQEEQR